MIAQVGGVRSEQGAGLAPPEPDGLVARIWRRWALRALNAPRPGPEKLDYKPEPLLIGAPELADRMHRGVFVFDGVGARADSGDPWTLTPPSDGWAETLHGFRWLEHFAAAGGLTAQERARALIKGWLAEHGRWRTRASTVGWRPAVVADRLTAWLQHQALTLENAGAMYRGDALRSLEAQARYLERFADLEILPMRRLAVGCGLVMAGLCLVSPPESVSIGVEMVENALEALLLADGGPVSRAPSDLLECLCRIAALQTLLSDQGGLRL